MPRKVAKAPKKVVSKPKDWKSQHSFLFKSDKRDFGVGRSVLPPKRDLSRFVKWPRYVRVQRQRAILKKRIKVPPAINQFAQTLEKNQASTLFRLLSHYRPESPKDKKERLLKMATLEKEGKPAEATLKQKYIKFGLQHVTTLVETKKAALVVIAHDVDPIELVIWLPALCRKMDIPYCIVKGKSRLGHLIYQKTATCLAITKEDVRKEDQARFEQLVSTFRMSYNEGDHSKWGERSLGMKSQHVVDRLAAIKAKHDQQAAIHKL
jgi:large subunit ribosomal protein L7Ae